MVDRFIFESYSFDQSEGVIRFLYRIEKSSDSERFCEVVTFPKEGRRTVSENTLRKALQTVHLALGINYWKLYCPKDIQTPGYQLSQSEAEFWNTVYTKGLGEFFYRNSLDFRGLVQFPFSQVVSNKIEEVPFQERALVGVGGGKDSIVTAELLLKKKLEFDGFIIETQKEYAINRAVSSLYHKKPLIVKRCIDPKLFAFHHLSTTFKGHVPVSALYACIGVLVALLYDYSSIIVSNEHSADIGNIEYLGTMVNHQWSKSSEFEVMMQAYISENISQHISYFSLLRPFNELKIAQLFCMYPKFFSLFSSCNRNFSIQTQGSGRWCGVCPKCIFVFILLSAFLPEESIKEIFGSNYFEKKTIIPLLKELTGIEGYKPFECVGTPEEVKAALYLVYRTNKYSDTAGMQFFKNTVLPTMKNPDKQTKELLEKKYDDYIPNLYRCVVEDV